MKKILTTAVFAIALAMVANAYDKTVSTFEDGIGAYFSTQVTPTENPNYSSYSGLLPSETTSTKYLEVSTDAALLRYANSNRTAENVTDNFYIDMMAQFNETESAVVDDNSDKLALYMNVDGKLVVVAGEGKTVCVTDKELTEGTWYRVIIRMIRNIYASGDSRPGFVVSINGENVSATAESYENVNISGSLTPTAQEYFNARQLFPSIRTEATISSLALTGVGSVDDIVFTDKRNADSAVKNPWAADPEQPAAVTYTIVNANGTDVATPKSVDYSTLDTGVYSVKASAEGKTATIVGDPIGVIKLGDTATDVLISVPWKTADGDNPTVADIVDESSLSNGDTLSVYSAAEQQFVSFTYNNGAWVRTVDTVVTTMDVNTVIAPGSAAYLHRTNTNSPICLIGKVASVGGATPEAGTSSAAKWSAFGSTVAVDKSIDDVITGEPEKATKNSLSGAMDMISVPKEDGTFVQYFCGKDGKWYTMTYKNGKPALSEAPEGVLKAGRGFMYRSKGGTPSISFGNN